MAKNKSNQGQSLKETLQSAFAMSSIVIALVIAWIVFKYIMGNPANFQDGNPEGNPLPGNYLAIIYKGGMIVPLLISLLIILITFSIERFIMISKAKGKSNLNVFVKNIQNLLNDNKIEEALIECDKQKGSLANIVKACLSKYRDLQNDESLSKEQKILAMQKEWDESAALELPMLSKNLVILSTIASIAVLIGLIGTVLGMIRAFAALAQAGSPDALALATGISEALINTAFGISGSTLAIILYNFFSTKIDALTYKMDEAGFSLVQTFAAQTKR
ncbi:MAG: MotA/TolQ/ExbB proton channel family protein [Bacteroidales bacterium]|jgi:biopolymer transport protein ExbB